MANPPRAPLVKDKLRPGFRENLGSWVCLPDGKAYSLPIVARQQRIHPVIVNGEIVMVNLANEDEVLIKKVEDFLSLCLELRGNEIALSEPLIIKVFELVRYLLLVNYSFDDAEITQILTLRHEQMAKLIETIQTHISRR